MYSTVWAPSRDFDNVLGSTRDITNAATLRLRKHLPGCTLRDADNFMPLFQYLRKLSNWQTPGPDGFGLNKYSQAEIAEVVRESILRVEEGTYSPGPARQVHIPKAAGGTRTLEVRNVHIRFIEKAYQIALSPRLETMLSARTYGYRVQSGPHQLLRDLKAWVDQGNHYFSVFDIKNAFPNTCWSLLDQTLRQLVGRMSDEACRHETFVPRRRRRANSVEREFISRRSHGRRCPRIEERTIRLVATGASMDTAGSGLSQGSALSPCLFAACLEQAIGPAREPGSPGSTVKTFIYADNVFVFANSLPCAKKTARALRSQIEHPGWQTHAIQEGNLATTDLTSLGHKFRMNAGVCQFSLPDGTENKLRDVLIQSFASSRPQNWFAMRNGYKRAWALVDTTELDDLLSRLSEELVHPERKLRSDKRTRHLSHTQRV